MSLINLRHGPCRKHRLSYCCRGTLQLICLANNRGADHIENTSSAVLLAACVAGVFTKPLPSSGHMLHSIIIARNIVNSCTFPFFPMATNCYLISEDLPLSVYLFAVQHICLSVLNNSSNSV
jgi:hypothetical protein